jgi:hypothetical protein
MFWVTMSDPGADEKDRANPTEWPSGAMWTVPTVLLFQYLVPARQKDPAGYANIKGELERRSFYATVTCRKRAGYMGSDWVDIRLVGQQSGEANELTFTAGESREAVAPVRSIFPNLDAVDKSSQLKVTLHEHGLFREATDASASVEYYFDGKRQLKLGEDGAYTVDFARP